MNTNLSQYRQLTSSYLYKGIIFKTDSSLEKNQ